MILPPESFYFSGQYAALPSRIDVSIRRYNTFQIELPKPKISYEGSSKRWRVKFQNGLVRYLPAKFFTKTEKRQEKERLKEQYAEMWYSDGLGRDALKRKDPFRNPLPVTCLARPFRLFPPPLMPYQFLSAVADDNLNRPTEAARFSFELALKAGPLFRKSRQELLERKCPTLMHPPGQPALIFHGYEILLLLRQYQREIIQKLGDLKLTDRQGRVRPMFTHEVMTKIRNKEKGGAPLLVLKEWTKDMWGAVPAFLRYVDPDLLVELLPQKARQRLRKRIEQWKAFVWRSLRDVLNDKNRFADDSDIIMYGLTSIRARSKRAPTVREIKRLTSKARNPFRAHTDRCLELLPPLSKRCSPFLEVSPDYLKMLKSRHPAMAKLVLDSAVRPPAKMKPDPEKLYLRMGGRLIPTQNHPLLPDYILSPKNRYKGGRSENPVKEDQEDLQQRGKSKKERLIRDYNDGDVQAALNVLCARQDKIFRHALENARSLLLMNYPPDAIVGLSLTELGQELGRIIRDQVRAAARQRKAGSVSSAESLRAARKRAKAYQRKKLSPEEMMPDEVLQEILEGNFPVAVKTLAEKVIIQRDRVRNGPDRNIDGTKRNSLQRRHKRLVVKLRSQASALSRERADLTVEEMVDDFNKRASAESRFYADYDDPSAD